MNRRSIAVASAMLFVLSLAVMAMAADDPFVGTWKMNLEKSKSNTTRRGPLAIKGTTIKVEAQGKALKFTQDQAAIGGQTFHVEWSLILDGKDYPDTSGQGETLSSARVADNAILIASRRNGYEFRTIRFAISEDGKALTLDRKLKDEKGEDVITTVEVYDRQ